MKKTFLILGGVFIFSHLILSYPCLKTGYLKRDNRVFYNDGVKLKELSKADVKTFKQIHSFVGKDKNNVYYGGEVIKGLDLESLEVYSDVISLEITEPVVECHPIIDVRFKDKNGDYGIGDIQKKFLKPEK